MVVERLKGLGSVTDFKGAHKKVERTNGGRGLTTIKKERFDL